MHKNRFRERLVCAPHLLQMVPRQWRVLMVLRRNMFDRESRRPIEGDQTARELIVERKLIAGEQADDRLDTQCRVSPPTMRQLQSSTPTVLVHPSSQADVPVRERSESPTVSYAPPSETRHALAPFGRVRLPLLRFLAPADSTGNALTWIARSDVTSAAPSAAAPSNRTSAPSPTAGKTDA